MEDEEEFLITEGEREIIIISDKEILKITDKKGLCWGEQIIFQKVAGDGYFLILLFKY